MSLASVIFCFAMELKRNIVIYELSVTCNITLTEQHEFDKTSASLVACTYSHVTR